MTPTILYFIIAMGYYGLTNTVHQYLQIRVIIGVQVKDHSLYVCFCKIVIAFGLRSKCI